MSYNKQEIPIDVLVLGGGAAGVSAAISAAKQGAKVALLERNAFLGGKATAAYVATICGLYYRSDKPQAQYVVEGFPKYFAEQLMERSKTQPIHYKEGLHFLSYQQFAFQHLCDELIQAEKNINLYLQSTVHNATIENDKINKIDVLVYNESVSFFPKAVVDCSGEALIAEWTNTNCLQEEIYQSSAQVFSLTNVANVEERTLSMSLMRVLQKAFMENHLAKEWTRLSIVPGSLQNQQVNLKLGIPIAVDNRLNKITPIQLKAREIIHKLISYLKANLPYFKNAQIGMIAPEVGIRTGKRHIGQYILKESDVLQCRKFKNSVAKGSWPIEHWALDRSPSMSYFEKDNYYDIPQGCLISNQLQNLYFAGRHISAEEKAIASARVIGTCLQTGEAAGILAVRSLMD